MRKRRVYVKIDVDKKHQSRASCQEYTSNPGIPHCADVLGEKVYHVIRVGTPVENATVAVTPIEEVAELEEAGDDEANSIARRGNLSEAAKKDREELSDSC